MSFKTPSFLFAALLTLLPLAAQPPAPRHWSGGVFVTTDSQPYAGASGITRVLPFVSYRSQSLEWYGPFLRYRAASFANWNLWLRAQADFGAYEEDDSAILNGMGDRSSTLLLGAGIQRDLTDTLSFSLSADRDVFGAHDGLEAVAGLTHRIGKPFMPLSGSLSGGVRFQDKFWTRDRVGVTPAQARDDRPVYRPDVSVHPYLSAMALYRLSDRWLLTAGIRYERLDTSWTDSPLVSDSGRLTSILTFSFIF